MQSRISMLHEGRKKLYSPRDNECRSTFFDSASTIMDVLLMKMRQEKDQLLNQQDQSVGSTPGFIVR